MNTKSYAIRNTEPRVRWAHLAAASCLALFALASTACNVIDLVLGRGARLTEMTPGGNVATGEIDCWLTLQFDRYPKGIDPRDVKVVFQSPALAGAAEFGWKYIASHDRTPNGDSFGSGYRVNEATTENDDPPLAMPIKVRFPLNTLQTIENAPSPLYLEAELWWGGTKQDKIKHTIDHVYSRSKNGFL